MKFQDKYKITFLAKIVPKGTLQLECFSSLVFCMHQLSDPLSYTSLLLSPERTRASHKQLFTPRGKLYKCNIYEIFYYEQATKSEVKLSYLKVSK